MKALFLHVDYINFKPVRKALKSVKDLSEEEKKGKNVKDALAVLIAVEKGDEIQGSAKELVKNIKDIASQVKTDSIVVYPYAHLSPDLSSPEVAIKVLEETENLLQKVKGLRVSRAPFGYYKEFELKVKGHPLAELSREIKIHGKEENSDETYDYKQLLRSVGKSVLDRSKLKKNDHRIIGQEMELFSFNEVAPGMVFWNNNGLIIYNNLMNYIREELRKMEYKEIKTPEILDKKLWQISGHWEKYKENIFLTDYEKRTFAAKPMNCPGGMIVFKENSKSYRDLPLRVAEFGIVHRQELSGVLAGLFRVIEFTQDDAHVFCTEGQLEKEIENLIDLMKNVYNKFGFDYLVELSTRPEKRIGSDRIWDRAEKELESVLKKNKLKFKINKGDGAFYGPKIDFHIKDSLGRTWQLGTIQLDFAMPERFGLEYTDKDNKKKTPVMLHRAIFGSIERFIGILLEHTNGRLPTWLAPTQVRILSFTERNVKHAETIIKKLADAIPSLRVNADFRNVTMQSKVKDAEIMRVPYVIVLGDKEEKKKTLAVREKGSGKIKSLKFEDFLKSIKEEIEERR
ncbi:threonine--tRNA ligase [Candidatus Pacearchaeota archaeon CG10_big_fil_rev_8_21_14_0_10_34_12]|nr:MAG: threonine--tRNA ligase [Candidatus Pacearchaeota archaeon CG10_big_fil_rev_8_21_14_0_10_34_12]